MNKNTKDKTKKEIIKHHKLWLKTKLQKKKKKKKSQNITDYGNRSWLLTCCVMLCLLDDNFFIYKRI